MKTLLISDTHLSHRFDNTKFNYLKNLFESVDKVIINGDFWDHHNTSFDQFLSSQWNQLFPILKNKDTVYIWGNHDDEFDKTKAEVFCAKVANKEVLKVANNELFITHGQEVVRYLNKIHILVEKAKFLHRPVGLVLDFLIRFTGKFYLKFAYSKMNNEMKAWAHQNLKQNQILVCGHSHLQEMDIQNQFIDLGGNTNGLKQYAIVTNTSITLYSKNTPTYSQIFEK